MIFNPLFFNSPSQDGESYSLKMPKGNKGNYLFADLIKVYNSELLSANPQLLASNEYTQQFIALNNINKGDNPLTLLDYKANSEAIISTITGLFKDLGCLFNEENTSDPALINLYKSNGDIICESEITGTSLNKFLSELIEKLNWDNKPGNVFGKTDGIKELISSIKSGGKLSINISNANGSIQINPKLKKDITGNLKEDNDSYIIDLILNANVIERNQELFIKSIVNSISKDRATFEITDDLTFSNNIKKILNIDSYDNPVSEGNNSEPDITSPTIIKIEIDKPATGLSTDNLQYNSSVTSFTFESDSSDTTKNTNLKLPYLSEINVDNPIKDFEQLSPDNNYIQTKAASVTNINAAKTNISAGDVVKVVKDTNETAVPNSKGISKINFSLPDSEEKLLDDGKNSVNTVKKKTILPGEDNKTANSIKAEIKTLSNNEKAINEFSKDSNKVSFSEISQNTNSIPEKEVVTNGTKEIKIAGNITPAEEVITKKVQVAGNKTDQVDNVSRNSNSAKSNQSSTELSEKTKSELFINKPNVSSDEKKENYKFDFTKLANPGKEPEYKPSEKNFIPDELKLMNLPENESETISRKVSFSSDSKINLINKDENNIKSDELYVKTKKTSKLKITNPSSEKMTEEKPVEKNNLKNQVSNTSASERDQILAKEEEIKKNVKTEEIKTTIKNERIINNKNDNTSEKTYSLPINVDKESNPKSNLKTVNVKAGTTEPEQVSKTFTQNNSDEKQQNQTHSDKKSNPENALFTKDISGFSKVTGNEIMSSPESTKNVRYTDIIKEITKFIISKDKNTITFNLEPESLGKLHIKLDIIENNAKVVVEVENEAVKKLVENNITNLFQNMNQEGLHLSLLQVSTTVQEQKHTKPGNQTKKKFDPEKELINDSDKELKTKNLGYNTYEFLI
jgi:flagellar hook-length control protein FliK